MSFLLFLIFLIYKGECDNFSSILIQSRENKVSSIFLEQDKSYIWDTWILNLQNISINGKNNTIILDPPKNFWCLVEIKSGNEMIFRNIFFSNVQSSKNDYQNIFCVSGSLTFEVILYLIVFNINIRTVNSL